VDGALRSVLASGAEISGEGYGDVQNLRTSSGKLIRVFLCLQKICHLCQTD
jgi:hypothetical protein